MKKAVLFDIDGTLVDSNDLHVSAWVQAFAGSGRVLDPRAIRAQIGKGGDNLVPALLPGLGEDEVEKLSDAHGEAFKARYLDLVRPFPGVRDLIARVHGAGIKVGLASSASKGELDHYVELLGIGEFLDAATTIDDVKASKPAPDTVAAALGKLGVAGADALFVGDTPYDIESGARAGVATVAVLSGGFDRDALRGAKAVYEGAAALLTAWPEWVE